MFEYSNMSLASVCQKFLFAAFQDYCYRMLQNICRVERAATCYLKPHSGAVLLHHGTFSTSPTAIRPAWKFWKWFAFVLWFDSSYLHGAWLTPEKGELRAWLEPVQLSRNHFISHNTWQFVRNVNCERRGAAMLFSLKFLSVHYLSH